MRRCMAWAVPTLLAVADLSVWPGALLRTGAVAPAGQVAAVVVATIAVALVLGFRTVTPVWSLVGTCGTLAVWRLLAPPASIGLITVSDLVALFSVAARCSARTTMVATVAAGAAATLVDLSVGDLVQGSSPVASSGTAVLVAAAYAMVAALGRVRRRWRLARHAATDRLAVAGAARQRAALVERHRLARDMHDIVAHRLTAVVVSANAGLRLGDRRPELAARALLLAAESGRETLEVVHRMVAVAGLDEPNPERGLRERLDELAAGLVLLGQPVTVHVDGHPAVGPGGGEPAAVVLAGHAIAREALTNALRYAPGVPVTIRLRHLPGVLELTVTNAGGTRPPARDLSGGGRGVPGMRERAALVGGALAAGPTAGGGWSVHATLPTGSPSGQEAPAPDPVGPGPAAPVASSGGPQPRDAHRDARDDALGTPTPGTVDRGSVGSGRAGRPRNGPSRQVGLLDAAIALLVIAIPTAMASLPDAGVPALRRPADVWWFAALCAVHGLPLLWRRQAPRTVLGCVVATLGLWPAALGGGLLPGTAGELSWPAACAECVAVYTVATLGGRPTVTWVAALVAASGDGAAVAAMMLATAGGPPATVDGLPGQIPGGVGALVFAGTVATLSAALFAVPFLAVWAAGTGVRLRRRRVLAMEHEALADAVGRAVRAAHDERARTAAGLRSAVLGHIERMAEAGDLAEVVDHARAALGAMRSLLATLGTGAAYRAAGTAVTLTGATGRGPLPPEVPDLPRGR